MDSLILDGRSLTLEALEALAHAPPASRGGPGITLDAEARDRMEASRRLVVEKVRSGAVVYGVTTGFGRLAEVAISPEDQELLQRNLLLSHAAGTGSLLSPPAGRG